MKKEKAICFLFSTLLFCFFLGLSSSTLQWRESSLQPGLWLAPQGQVCLSQECPYLHPIPASIVGVPPALQAPRSSHKGPCTVQGQPCLDQDRSWDFGGLKTPPGGKCERLKLSLSECLIASFSFCFRLWLD